MSNFCHTLLMLAVSLPVPARPLYFPEGSEVGLQGNWRQVQGEFEGRAQDSEGMNQWRISADKITILIQNADRGSWTYRIYVKGEAAQLDLTPTNAPNVTYPCLMRIEGNRIIVCLQNFPERGRPTDFISRPGSGIGRYVYERLP